GMDGPDVRRAGRNQGRIDLVVLRQPQIKAPMGAPLRGLEHDDHKTTLPQPPDDRLLVAASGFDSDPFAPVLPQPDEQLLVPLGRIGHLQPFRPSMQRHIELVLASIDAGANYATLAHLLDPPLNASLMLIQQCGPRRRCRSCSCYEDQLTMLRWVTIQRSAA